MNDWRGGGKIEGGEITEVTATEYLVADSAPFQTYNIALATGFTNEENNRAFIVGDVAAGSIQHLSVEETTPTVSIAAESTIRIVGYLFLSGAFTHDGDGMFTSTGFDLLTLGLQVGDWIKFGSKEDKYAFNEPLLNQYFQIVSLIGDKMQVQTNGVAIPADPAPTKRVAILYGDALCNGAQKPRLHPRAPALGQSRCRGILQGIDG